MKSPFRLSQLPALLLAWMAVLSPCTGKTQTAQAWGTGTSGQIMVPGGLNNVAAVSAGWDFSAVLRTDGSALAWGKNDYGQATVPAGLSNVVAIDAGRYHSLALKADGTVISWGAYQTVPTGLNLVTAISAGGHSVALRADGTVVAWGTNDIGQTDVPAGLTGVIAVAAGEKHSLALKSDGSVVGWGQNDHGQITTPAGLGPVKAIAAGTYHSLALLADGTVAVWGQNTFGQLNLPAGITDVIAVSTGAQHSFALRADGTAVTWGRTIPGVLSLPQGVIASGFSGGITHSLAVIPAGAETGSPFFIGPVSVTAAEGMPLRHEVLAARRTGPFTVTGLPEWLSFDAQSGLLTGTPPQAGTYTIQFAAPNAAGAVSQTLTLHVNLPLPLITSSSELTIYGDAPFSYRVTAANSPASFSATGLPPGLTLDPVSGWITGKPLAVNDYPVTIGAVNASGRHSATLMIRVRTIGSFGSSNPVATVPPGLDRIVEICESTRHALARRSDGTVAAWGENTSGQLNVPPGLQDVTAIAAGGYSSLALRRDGTVVEWGSPGNPSMPAGLSDVVAISACNTRCMALKRDGTVVAWGYRDLELTQPPGLSQVVGIAAAGQHCLALRADGTLAGWGLSRLLIPSIVTSLQNVEAVSAGEVHSTVIIAGDTLRSWGVGLSIRNWLWQEPGVAMVATGYDNVIALKNDGSITGRGDNSYGQLNLPADFGPAAAVASGFFHTSVLTANEPGVAEPLLMNSCFAMGAVDKPFKWRIRARNSPVSYAAEGLPPGLSVDAATGLISGTPQQVGDFPVSISSTNAAGDAEMKVRFTILSTPAPALHHAASSAAYCGIPYSFQLLSNHTSATWTASGLPAGLTLDSGTGIISGTPAAEGRFRVTVTVTNPYGTVSGTLELTAMSFAVWGANNAGQLNFPEDAKELISLAGGTAHSLGLRRNGKVIAWGNSAGGVLDVPSGLTDVAAIYARGTNNLALRNDGTLVTWGTTPAVPAGHRNVVAAAAGAAHALALSRDGTVTAWGDNSFGQCSVPLALSGVIAVAAGDYFSVALQANGTVVAWGKNTDGQTNVPAGLAGVIAIACNADDTAWLKSDGSTGAFGRNPVTVGPWNVKQIAAAGDQYLALLNSGGDLKQWGALGGAAPLPVGLNKASLIAGGLHHALALTQLDLSTPLPVILNPPFALGVRDTPFHARIFTRNGAVSYSATGLPLGLGINATTGVISGTPLGRKTYTVTLHAVNAAGTASKTLSLTINDLWQTYAQWAADYFTSAQLADPSISGADADPDSDGLPNRMEAVLGSSPKSPASSPGGFVSIPGGTASEPRLAGQISLTLRPPPDLACRVEVSASLTDGSWTTIAERTGPGIWSGNAVVSELNGRMVLEVSAPQSPLAPRCYMRLVVSGP